MASKLATILSLQDGAICYINVGGGTEEEDVALNKECLKVECLALLTELSPSFSDENKSNANARALMWCFSLYIFYAYPLTPNG